jgi:hypothetical protein
MEGTSSTVRTRIPAREIDALVKLLEEKGPLGAPTIRRELETCFWGLGRLRAALVEARRRGLVRRIGARTFEATDA